MSAARNGSAGRCALVCVSGGGASCAGVAAVLQCCRQPARDGVALARGPPQRAAVPLRRVSRGALTYHPLELDLHAQVLQALAAHDAHLDIAHNVVARAVNIVSLRQPAAQCKPVAVPPG